MSTAKLKKVDETFSERLKTLRLGRGWSQEDLAARLDVSPGSVGNWEMGPHVPHPKTLKKIEALLEVGIGFLLHGEHVEAPAMVREQPPEYQTLNLVELLREVEEARDRLDRVAKHLRKATTKPGAAAALTEVASVGYDQNRKREGGKNPAKEAQRIVSKLESHHSK
jgi:transcriptional regulator with XRE-family HTH domain